MNAAILALDDVKAILGITDTASDEKLTAALPVVTEYFENHCKRGLAYVADVVEEMAIATRLPLFRYPIDTVASVLVNDAPVDPAHVYKAQGVVRLGYCNYWYPQMAVITYSGGYAQDEVPADLADAYAKCCADFAGVPYTAGGTGSSGAPLKSLGLGSGALTVAFDTAAQAQSAYDTSAVPSVLSPYLFVLEHYRCKDSV